jgi:hypothetical protein
MIARLWKRLSAPKTEAPRRRVDKLIDLPDSDLDVWRVIEGDCTHYHSVSLDGCPWPRSAPTLWQAWRRGWLGASIHRDQWEQEDTRRWLLPIKLNQVKGEE